MRPFPRMKNELRVEKRPSHITGYYDVVFSIDKTMALNQFDIGEVHLKSVTYDRINFELKAYTDLGYNPHFV